MTLPEDEHPLPELPPELEHELAQALRAAWAPGELAPARLEQLIEAALEDPFAPASPEELAESERFRKALAGEGEHRDLPLARALKSAHDAPPLSEHAERRIARQSRKARTGKVYFVSFGVSALLAAAAAFALWAPAGDRSAAEPALHDLAQSRSTAPLFSEAFAGSTSTRIDRIADARTRDLRDNRYAAWGLR
ncbi:MAG TPA: hypothetical protein VGM44_17505 [Polyangiaceae bacterium]|jgi:hypothetical protein